jgi:hypothetical protein
MMRTMGGCITTTTTQYVGENHPHDTYFFHLDFKCL